jgi:hypothetical protein
MASLCSLASGFLLAGLSLPTCTGQSFIRPIRDVRMWISGACLKFSSMFAPGPILRQFHAQRRDARYHALDSS